MTNDIAIAPRRKPRVRFFKAYVTCNACGHFFVRAFDVSRDVADDGTWIYRRTVQHRFLFWKWTSVKEVVMCTTCPACYIADDVRITERTPIYLMEKE